MKIKSISFINYGFDISEIQNRNIDVFVELTNGYRYVVTLATLESIQSLMQEEKKNYFGPCDLVIIVKTLTHEVIAETIMAFAYEKHGYILEEGYYLKLYHFANRIPETVFNQLQAEDEAQKEAAKAVEKLYGDNDYPLYGGYESYQSDEDGLDKNEELFTYIKF
jgi:hypothetical protein